MKSCRSWLTNHKWVSILLQVRTTAQITGYVPYRTKLWQGENFGEFGESPQSAKFFSPTFPMKHENAGKPWIRQSFFRQCFKITISPKFFTAKVLFYTVLCYVSSNGNILIIIAQKYLYVNAISAKPVHSPSLQNFPTYSN